MIPADCTANSHNRRNACVAGSYELRMSRKFLLITPSFGVDLDAAFGCVPVVVAQAWYPTFTVSVAGRGKPLAVQATSLFSRPSCIEDTPPPSYSRLASRRTCRAIWSILNCTKVRIARLAES
jgi:hypothetical protein